MMTKWFVFLLLNSREGTERFIFIIIIILRYVRSFTKSLNINHVLYYVLMDKTYVPLTNYTGDF